MDILLLRNHGLLTSTLGKQKELRDFQGLPLAI